MAIKDKITLEKVKKSGIFDFKETYQFAYRWLSEESYDVEEEKYVESVSGDSKNIEILWKASKKLSDYFKIELKLSWRIIGMKNVEVEKQGKRVKMNDGSIEVKITGTLIRDYNGDWDSNPFTKFLRETYDKFIINSRIEQYEGKVFSDVNEVAEQLKAFWVIEGMK